MIAMNYGLKKSAHPSLSLTYSGYPHLLILAAISFLVGFTLGTIILLLWRLAVNCYRKADSHEEPNTTTTLFSPRISHAEDLSFLLNVDHHDIERPLDIIGRGGCGEVYKAEILTGRKNMIIAIKKVLHPLPIDTTLLNDEENRRQSHRLRQIKSEIRTVGRMTHCNLLSLLAHVSLPGCDYLIYEFMKNGSLHDVLRRRRPQLDWPARHKIALGIAEGLEYLHMVHRPRVIHRDLKPANILLDHGLNARISDFGMAKVVPDAVRMSGLMSTNVAGTLGYIAPEYYQTMSCTDKCDVYSFGVIMAVLVTGRFPSDQFFQMGEEISLLVWLRRVMSTENPSEALDQTLRGQGFEEQMLLVLKIACFCTYDDPKKRPNSRDVRCMLSQIKQ